MDLKAKIHLQEGISYMDIGKIINHLSSRLRSRSQAVHAKLRIENAQGKILNFILVESALHPVYCIFRKNRALAPHERSAVPLGTDHCPVG